MSSAAGIANLQKAEDAAAKIIQEARLQRTRRLAEARIDAQAKIDEYRAKKEAAYRAALAATTNIDAERAEAEKATQVQVEEMRKAFSEHKDEVVDLLLYYVTSVSLDVPASLKAKAAHGIKT